MNFSILTLSMSLRYLGSVLYMRGPYTVVAFSGRDCAGSLFVGYSVTHGSMSWMASVFFVSNCTIHIRHQMCYLPNL